MDEKTWLYVGGAVGAAVLIYLLFLHGSSSSSSPAPIVTGGFTSQDATALAESGLQYELGQQELGNQLSIANLQYNVALKQIGSQQAIAQAEIAQQPVLANIQSQLLQQLAAYQLQETQTQANAQEQMLAEYGSTLQGLQPSPTSSVLGSLGNFFSQAGSGLTNLLGSIGL